MAPVSHVRQTNDSHARQFTSARQFTAGACPVHVGSDFDIFFRALRRHQRGIESRDAIKPRMGRMHVRRSQTGVEIQTPAKLNLFLEVLAKRADGFHDIETLMVPVSLYDTLHVAPRRDEQITLQCRFDHASPEPLSVGEDNLIVRAIRRLRAFANRPLGCDVTLWKRIPLAAGLAGGSSDAAAALVGANLACNLELDRGALTQVAASLGSDIPFFLDGRAAVCRGRGEIIEPVEHLGALHFVVVRPPIGLGTAEVYRGCRAATEPRHCGQLIHALQRGCLSQAGRCFYNALQPAASRLTPWIERLRDEFTRLGVMAHQMSGSGSSYFGLCAHAAQARRLAARLSQRGVGRVFAISSVV